MASKAMGTASLPHHVIAIPERQVPSRSTASRTSMMHTEQTPEKVPRPPSLNDPQDTRRL